MSDHLHSPIGFITRQSLLTNHSCPAVFAVFAAPNMIQEGLLDIEKLIPETYNEIRNRVTCMRIPLEKQMKIGQFASRHNTSIDTIRHYMSLGLLIPEKHNAQYDFDENCTHDFFEITELKKTGFSLHEIQQLILFRRIGKLTDYDRRVAYTSFFERKIKAIDQEIASLSEMKHSLNQSLGEMRIKLEQDESQKPDVSGVTFRSLELFACPLCHEPFEITEGNIQGGTLIHAALTCPCGYRLRIENGIVFATDLAVDGYESIENECLGRYSEQFIDQYIDTTHMDYLKKLHTGLMWSLRHITPEAMSDKIALELGSGHGYFLRHMLDRFPASCTYIAVDHNPVKMMWLKKIIERSHPACTVIYLCADFTKLPLKADSIEVLLDISGSSNYSFDHPEFLLELIDPLLKRDVRIHGYYILFENFVAKSKIPLGLQGGFKIQLIKSHLKDLHFVRLDDYLSEPVEKGGPLEDYFVDGERVRTYLFSGVKSVKPLG